MRDQYLQERRVALNLLAPVVDERGGQHQQVGFLLPGLQGEGEHGQHLECLAQPHVVGQAAAELQAAQRPQPLHPELLIGAQLGRQAGSGVDVGLQSR